MNVHHQRLWIPQRSVHVAQRVREHAQLVRERAVLHGGDMADGDLGASVLDDQALDAGYTAAHRQSWPELQDAGFTHAEAPPAAAAAIDSDPPSHPTRNSARRVAPPPAPFAWSVRRSNATG